MDAVSLLKKQHRQVEGLFKELEHTDDAGGRRELMRQLREMVEMHTSIEEEIFYPAVREVESKKAEEMVLEAYEEHHVVDLVLKDLPNVDPEDERFEAKMTVLKELIEHHVEEEEDEMFKLAAKLGKDELNALGERMLGRMPEEMRGEMEKKRGRRAA